MLGRTGRSQEGAERREAADGVRALRWRAFAAAQGSESAGGGTRTRTPPRGTPDFKSPLRASVYLGRSELFLLTRPLRPPHQCRHLGLSRWVSLPLLLPPGDVVTTDAGSCFLPSAGRILAAANGYLARKFSVLVNRRRHDDRELLCLVLREAVART